MNSFENDDTDRTPLTEINGPSPFFLAKTSTQKNISRSYSSRSGTTHNSCFQNAFGICWLTCFRWPKTILLSISFFIGVLILLIYLFGNQEKHHLILEKVEKTMEQVGIKMPKFEKATSVSEKQDDVWSGNFSGFYRAVDGGGHYQKVSREDGNLYNDLVRDLAFREDTLRISSEESKDEEDDQTVVYYTVVATSSTREKVHTERYRFTSGRPFHYLNEEDNLQAVINIAEDQWWQMVVGANVAIGRRFTDQQMTAMWKAGEALYVRSYKREPI